MMKSIRHTFLSRPCMPYWTILGVLALVVINGLYYAWYMEHNGHWVTGMSNQVVWGAPHIAAIFLILCASGVLNVASVSSLFGNKLCQPWSRLSGLLAITFLIGGLLVLVLDLGRPDRLIIAMTHYNFKSIFAWNVFLYIGFILIVAAYLWVQFEPRLGKYTARAGLLAFVWRIVLTTGTGSIFAFLIARQPWDSALLALIFIALSLVLGTALFILFVRCCYLGGESNDIESIEPTLQGLGRMLGYFVCVTAFLTLVFHLTKLYGSRSFEFEAFLLDGDNAFTILFWIGYVLLGTVLPIVFLFAMTRTLKRVLFSSGLVIFGGVCHLYTIIIGGQVYPMELFPGMTESSSFFDGVVASYTPSFSEISLGLGGVAISVLAALLVMRVLPFMPESGALKLVGEADK